MLIKCHFLVLQHQRLLCLLLMQGAVATTADGKGLLPEHHEQYIGE